MADQPYNYSAYAGGYGEMPMLYGNAYTQEQASLPSSRSSMRGLGLLMLVLSTCWGSYLQESGTGTAIVMAYVSQFLVVLLGLMVLAGIGFTGSALKMTAEFVLLLGLLLWALVGFPFAVSSELSRIAIGTLMKLLVMGLIILNMVNGRNAYMWLLVGLILAMIFASVGAVTGLARGVEIVGQGYGQTRRYTGTFGNANEAGQLACLGVWAAFSIFLGIRHRFVKVILISIMVWGIVVVAWTASKGALLGLAVGGVVAYWFVLRRTSRGVGAKTGWFIVIAVCFAVASSYFAASLGGERLGELLELRQGGGARSDRVRLGLLKRSADIFIQNPVLGVGYGSVGAVVYSGSYKSPHNTIVAMAAETGLPGWLMFFGAWFVAINRLRRLGKLAIPPVDYRLAMCGWILFAMLGLWSLTGELEKFKPFWVCFAGLVAYLVWVEHTYRELGEESPSPYPS